MALSEDKLIAFVSAMVERGLGLYGVKRMAEICYDSGIALTDKNEIDWLNDDHYESVKNLLINYASVNLPAKMTAIVLARRNNIPIPKKIMEKRKKSRWKIRKKY
ncbi:MAG: hypothetical protein ACFFDK_18995 [Promethearchaeota archaeon]